MIRRICLALLVTCTGVFADAPATQPTTAPSAAVVPATQPTTQPGARNRRERAAQAAAPATAPSTQPSAKAESKFPTPDELMAKIREQQAAQARKLKVAYFDLSSPLSEAPAGFSLFGGSTETLHDLLTRLAKARDDKDVRAVLITLKPGFGANLAQAQELRDALADVRRAGKRTFVYADSYDTLSYLIASAATDVCILGGGELFMPGLSIETMFYRGVMDKVGVQPDFIQIGEYKGAEEPYMRTTPSDELRAEMNKIVESYYNQIVASVSMSRNLSGDAVRQVIDEAIVSADQGKQRGLIDHVTDIDGLRALIATELSDEVELLADYGESATPELNFDNPLLLISQLMRKPPESTKPSVALIYAEGVISDGDASGGLFGSGGVGSENMRAALRIAHRDDKIKAIVIRIDSPGGSALASEAMWQAIRRVGKDKPVIISIGGMAASGGYYLAVAGDYIYADPGAIVGSIGVVGGKFVLKGLYDWAGLTTEEFSRGRNANLFSSSAPWDDRQKRMVRTWMKNTYDQFTSRVMETRRGKIKDIDTVARGRIFLAKDAFELGMVDQIGGLNAAITHAARAVELEDGAYDIRVVPAPMTIGDLLRGGGPTALMPMQPTFQIAPESVLHLMPDAHRMLIGRQIQLGKLLQKRPVVLMSPYIINVR